MKKYKKESAKESDTDKSKQVISDLIDMKNVDTDDEKGKFLQLITGLVHADNSIAKKFLNDINTFTSKLDSKDY
jgi:hypothetical protein